MYQRSATIENTNRTLAQWFPSTVEHLPLGESHGGRPISAIRISAGEARDRHAVVFIGGTHARELLNPNLLSDLAIRLLVSYFAGSDITLGGRTWSADTIRIVMEALDIIILPNVNPDGRETVLDGQRMWRKNRADNGGTDCIGVDLNRNHDLLWGVETVHGAQRTTSGQPCDPVYFGPSAASEPESRCVVQLLDRFDVDCLVDVHSFSELILHPWGHAKSQTHDPSQRFTLVDTSGWRTLPTDAQHHEEYIPPADLERHERVGAAAAKAIHDVRGRTYKVQPGPDLYVTTGTTSDYAYGRHVNDASLHKTYAFTFETGYRVLNVERSFQPDFPEADRIAEEASSGLLSVLHSCVCAIHLIATDLFGSEAEDTLDAMRAVRDERLAETDAGRAWAGLLDRNQAELSELAATDESFRTIAGELFTIAGKVLEVGELDREAMEDARRLLADAERADVSPGLRADLHRLRLASRQMDGMDVEDALAFLGKVPPARHGR